MTETQIKKRLLRALSQHQGDDLARARLAFRGMTPEQMQEPWGQSGRTKQQVLDEYETHEAEISTCAEWVRSR